MTNDATELLKRLQKEMERRAEFWRNAEDTHGLGTATMVACIEVAEGIKTVLKEVEK